MGYVHKLINFNFTESITHLIRKLHDTIMFFVKRICKILGLVWFSDEDTTPQESP